MNEIKVRVWDTTSKKMYCSKKVGGYTLEQIQRLNSKPEDAYTRFMLFIGRKDKTGFDIYEDDVLELEAFGYVGENDFCFKFTGVVKFMPSKGFYLKCSKKEDCINGGVEITKVHKPISAYRCEIIGNIHKNPELLK